MAEPETAAAAAARGSVTIRHRASSSGARRAGRPTKDHPDRRRERTHHRNVIGDITRPAGTNRVTRGYRQVRRGSPARDPDAPGLAGQTVGRLRPPPLAVARVLPGEAPNAAG